MNYIIIVLYAIDLNICDNKYIDISIYKNNIYFSLKKIMNQQIIHSIIDTIKYKYLLNNREQDQNNIGEIVIISLIFIVISYIFTNVRVFENISENISEKLSNLFVYKRYNCIVLEGKRCFRMNDYNTRSDQLFSNRFKAIWYYLAKNNNNSDSLYNYNYNNNNKNTIYSIKEFADSSNIYD